MLAELPFPRYDAFDPAVPVWCVTPSVDRCLHRFFDTSPFSPSGRYLGLTRLPHEDRLPGPGDAAEVVLVDLELGGWQVVAETRGWDTQLGAQVQWGATDHELLYNDLDTRSWHPFGVVLDPLSGEIRRLHGPLYMASPDGRWAASPCLLRTSRLQAGYGVIAPPEWVPENEGASGDDGVYLTDMRTGECRLAVSIARIAAAAPEVFARALGGDGALYGFHVKWNPQGDRLQFVVRWLPGDGAPAQSSLVTFRPDSSQIRVAVPASIWAVRGGHHPNWCPDGEGAMMNLNLHGDGMRFVRVRWEGSDLASMTEAVPGSGHPTLHPDRRHLLTDAYPHEPVAFGDGTVPIRLVDLALGNERTLVRIRTRPAFAGPAGELRVDPHPAWNPSFRRVAFNACPDGTRRVYVADLRSAL